MRFIDEAIIKVAGGNGGPGCVSFRRETFVPRGGPDGGDGGAGGSITFVGSVQLGTLQDFRYKRTYQAPSGDHGSGANKAGRDGEEIKIRVPLGTTISNAETGEVLVDIQTEGQEWLACKGGRGGKGNAHFVSSTFQAPKFAQPGEAGSFMELKLELKLLADAAIIGFPNAGKSTLISQMSAARPKVADYAFTTLTPNLGVVAVGEYESFVIADTPGLIEGAHAGVGLGHRFLKHIERTHVFVHLLDGTKILEDATAPETRPGTEGFKKIIEELIRRYEAIRNELGLYNEELLHKPEIVVLNKIDLIESDPDLLEAARKALRERIAQIRGSHPEGGEPFLISAVSGRGVDGLKNWIYREIRRFRVQKDTTSREALSKLRPDDPAIRRKQ
jgi:GTP-binding protein